MRGLFFLLLMSNVAFLIWQTVTPVSEGVNGAGVTVPMVNEGLTLLSELERDKRPPLRESLDKDSVEAQPLVPHTTIVEDASTSGKAESNIAGSAFCLQVDKIDSESALQSLLRVLGDDGTRVIEQGERQGTKDNYWVMLPPYPTRAKADEAAAILNSKKITDFFIVRSGEYENAVSLGVFSERERAERRHDQIVALKVRLRKPRIETIALPAKQYFIILSTGDTTVQRRTLERLNALGYASVAKVNCK